MKFKFKTQQYQTDAVNAIADVFKGQRYHERNEYTLDRGVAPKKHEQMSLFNMNADEPVLRLSDDDIDLGFSNAEIEISDKDLLKSIKEIQQLSNIKESNSLCNKLGKVELDVEMETGTGKTYVYIKTMFELNKRYGFSKFIVVVPSIAIREGVYKTFTMTEDHFMDTYGKKARYFIYDSKKLDKIEQYSSSNSINVMIINIQAFNARGADARRIYEELDEFRSRRPIDVIAKNRPIIILDEPQKMGGDATQESLQRFMPLFTMNFSATHKTKHNLVYVLDAVDAYNKKLVKKIEVKGFTLKNLRGTNGYLYLQDIIISPNKPPMAKIELEILYNSGKMNRETRLFKAGDNLYQTSNELEEYKDGFTISEINPYNNAVTFINGDVLELGNAVGNVNEMDVRRIQIRETIKSHFEKEEELFNKGIKVLSLFFIDEVAKYRQYDEDGNQILGQYGKIFEEEYIKAYNERGHLLGTAYDQYLESTIQDVSKVHRGYFSIDKKGRSIDSKVSRGSDTSDDESAYDLILKDKERLLSFEEPTRFIFSHSALREGWDNPNVFQICTLKYSSNDVQRRQEVGRGLRICVNKNGDRMDSLVPNIDFFDINKLTVIANESYESFVDGLQKDIKDNLYERPMKASIEYFANKLIQFDGNDYRITPSQANAIHNYLVKNDYIDDDDKPTEKYKEAVANNSLEPMKPELEPMAEEIHKLVQSIYDESVIKNMVSNGHQAVVQENGLNSENFNKKEFQKLWKLINHKYSYFVDFDSNELISKSVQAIDSNLYVTEVTYTITTGEQKDEIDANQVENRASFKNSHSTSKTLKESAGSNTPYDLIGKIVSQTSLTRRTVATILKQISPVKFAMYKTSPEEFINKVSKIINEQKASLIIDHVTYNQIDGSFDSTIFAESKTSEEFKNAYKSLKCIKEYVFVDGISKTESVERKFAEALDQNDEVVVFAKMPRSFYIPTPVGNYSPDWAIAFKEGTVKHIYFLAETKGSLDTLQLRGVENAKIECAKKLFNKMSTSEVRYEQVTNYSDLMEKMNSME